MTKCGRPAKYFDIKHIKQRESSRLLFHRNRALTKEELSEIARIRALKVWKERKEK